MPEHVVRVSPSGELLWARPGRLVTAREIGTDLVAVGELGEGADEPMRAVFRLDAEGRTLWRRPLQELGPMSDRRDEVVLMERAGGGFVVVTLRGAIGLDASGGVLWTQPEPHSHVSQVVADTRGDRALIAVTRTASAEELGETSRCAVRVLDTSTGAVLGERAVPFAGTRCSIGELVFPSAPAAPAVLAILDIFDRHETTSEGDRIVTTSERRVLAVDPTSLVVRGATTLPSRGEGEHDAELPLYDGRVPAPSEVVLVDHYASAPERLALSFVDVGGSAGAPDGSGPDGGPPVVRTFGWLIPEPTGAGGHDFPSYLQVFRVERTAHGLDLAAQMTGVVRAPSGERVANESRAVEACEASGFLECSPGDETVLVAPLAALVVHLSCSP